jgi:hypothetical protein
VWNIRERWQRHSVGSPTTAVQIPPPLSPPVPIFPPGLLLYLEDGHSVFFSNVIKVKQITHPKDSDFLLPHFPAGAIRHRNEVQQQKTD